MQHLDPGLEDGDGAIRTCGDRLPDFVDRTDGRDLAVAAGPVRAAEAGIGDPHETAEEDQVESQEQRDQQQATEACGPIRRRFGTDHPILEAFSRRCRSLRTFDGSGSAGKRIIRLCCGSTTYR